MYKQKSQLQELTLNMNNCISKEKDKNMTFERMWPNAFELSKSNGHAKRYFIKSSK